MLFLGRSAKSKGQRGHTILKLSWNIVSKTATYWRLAKVTGHVDVWLYVASVFRDRTQQDRQGSNLVCRFEIARTLCLAISSSRGQKFRPPRFTKLRMCHIRLAADCIVKKKAFQSKADHRRMCVFSYARMTLTLA